MTTIRTLLLLYRYDLKLNQSGVI